MLERMRSISGPAAAMALAMAVAILAGCPVRGPVCGDGLCSAGEGACIADCAGGCDNDGVCEAGESTATCPNDCPDIPACNMDGICDAPLETNANCPSDCGIPPACGDGVCSPGETTATCPADCSGTVCGNGVCNPGENMLNCPADCGGTGPVCGDGVCQVGESMTSCPGDCPSAGVCGDGSVDVGEQCDPPNGIDCDSTCMLFTMTGPANPGAACSVDSTCSSGGAGLPVLCLNEATYEWPGGYCLIYDCTIDAATGTDDCPGTSHCEAAFSDGMGGFIYACLPDCTPSTTGLGGCRSSSTTTYAYTCRPDVVDPAAPGGCFIGCNTADGCNFCDTSTGTCNDGISACTDDADCQALGNYACSITINACYPDHSAGSASIGDPCTDDLDCPANAFCAGGDAFPGGFCTVFYCDSFASVTGFGCPAGSTCPAVSGFLGGLLQICSANCTVAGTDPDGGCDSARGDNFDYYCTEPTATAMTVAELYDTTGASGFCFQCDALFSPADCPAP